MCQMIILFLINQKREERGEARQGKSNPFSCEATVKARSKALKEALIMVHLRKELEIQFGPRNKAA